MRVLIACEYSGTVRDAFIDGYIIKSNGVIIGKRGLPLKQVKDKKGYPQVAILINKKLITKRVHRLIAEIFLENPQKKPCVRHVDGNKENNNESNLAWGTYKENEDDKINHGTWGKRFSGKLSSQDRDNIKKLYSEGIRQDEIAIQYSVSRPTISRLINGSTWSHQCVS